MTNQETGLAEQVDPLAMTAGEVDTSFPLIRNDTLCNMEVLKAEKNLNESKGTESIKFTLITTKEELDSNNQPLRVGFPVYSYLGITPNEKYPVESIKKNGATILKACGLPTASVRDLINNPAIVVGKVVMVKVKVNAPQGSFPASNSVNFVEPKKG